MILMPNRARQVERIEAVMALFQGEPASQVARRYQMSRSTLYKLRRRAIIALRQGLADQPRGPAKAHNRLAPATEEQVVALCQRHPTWSSYAIHKHFGSGAPSPSTIRRVRARHGLRRLSKRTPATRRAHRLTPEERRRIEAMVEAKPYLGPERTAWDLQNDEGLSVSPSTVKRLQRKRREALLPLPAPPEWRFYERHHPHSLWHGDFMEKVTLTDLDRTAYQFTLQDDYSRAYVFCDLFLEPDNRSTIRSLIAAMRRWQTIPRALVFDNGSPFKGRLLTAFCQRLGIRLIHAAVNHPQTNGKLERAFRDDMRDFYERYDTWNLNELRRDLPAYVHYRNHVRGHCALGGKPAITRLREQTWTAPRAVLDRLESYACYEIGRKSIPGTGSIRLFGRDAHLGATCANLEVTFVETLEGLEARLSGQCVAVLKDYRTFMQMASFRKEKIPRALYFEPRDNAICQ
jgi:transposase InsO family protein